jgi:hypothetical protein
MVELVLMALHTALTKLLHTAPVPPELHNFVQIKAVQELGVLNVIPPLHQVLDPRHNVTMPIAYTAEKTAKLGGVTETDSGKPEKVKAVPINVHLLLVKPVVQIRQTTKMLAPAVEMRAAVLPMAAVMDLLHVGVTLLQQLPLLQLCQMLCLPVLVQTPCFV